MSNIIVLDSKRKHKKNTIITNINPLTESVINKEDSYKRYVKFNMHKSLVVFPLPCITNDNDNIITYKNTNERNILIC